jgi:hypothetical protein
LGGGADAAHIPAKPTPLTRDANPLQGPQSCDLLQANIMDTTPPVTTLLFGR